jgi:hypothetical protein
MGRISPTFVSAFLASGRPFGRQELVQVLQSLCHGAPASLSLGQGNSNQTPALPSDCIDRQYRSLIGTSM